MAFLSLNKKACRRDGLCAEECPLSLLTQDNEGYPEAKPESDSVCIRCGHCVAVCPHRALHLDAIDDTLSVPLRPELAISAGAAEQFLKSRRSVRAYEQRPVPREVLAQLLDVTRWAPSATNRQPVKWIVFDDREQLRALAGLAAEGLRKIPYFARLVADWDKGCDRIFRGAPALAIAFAEQQAFDPGADCTIAITYLELAAHAHGLGACWAGVLLAAMPQNPEIVRFLEIPGQHRVYAAMMLGYPKNAYARIPVRNPLNVTWR